MLFCSDVETVVVEGWFYLEDPAFGMDVAAAAAAKGLADEEEGMAGALVRFWTRKTMVNEWRLLSSAGEFRE